MHHPIILFPKATEYLKDDAQRTFNLYEVLGLNPAVSPQPVYAWQLQVGALHFSKIAQHLKFVLYTYYSAYLISQTPFIINFQKYQIMFPIFIKLRGHYILYILFRLNWHRIFIGAEVIADLNPDTVVQYSCVVPVHCTNRTQLIRLHGRL